MKKLKKHQRKLKRLEQQQQQEQEDDERNEDLQAKIELDLMQATHDFSLTGKHYIREPLDSNNESETTGNEFKQLLKLKKPHYIDMTQNDMNIQRVAIQLKDVTIGTHNDVTNMVAALHTGEKVAIAVWGKENIPLMQTLLQNEHLIFEANTILFQIANMKVVKNKDLSPWQISKDFYQAWSINTGDFYNAQMNTINWDANDNFFVIKKKKNYGIDFPSEWLAKTTNNIQHIIQSPIQSPVKPPPGGIIRRK